MSSPQRAHRLATAEDLLALPEDARVEIIAGELVEKAMPGFDHGDCQLAIGGDLRQRFRGTDGEHPGWWFAAEVDVEFTRHDILRPDIAGWRRDRHPEKPHGRPVRARPDWVCEILSPSTAHIDLGPKLEIYARGGVAHYWIVDIEKQVLTVFRLVPDGYLLSTATGPHPERRLPPFDHVALDVRAFFGLEPPAPPAPPEPPPA